MKSNQKGITLVELLAVLALVGIITTLAWTALSIGFQHSAIETSQTQLQQEATLLMTTLTNEHRRSDHYYLRYQDGHLELKTCTETACESFERITTNNYSYNGSVNDINFDDLDPNMKIEPKKAHVEVSLIVADPENLNNEVTVTTTLTRILTSMVMRGVQL
ncbi:prepilin-type N-terminal cleavage/methylation domain-containing protein [Planococcus salinus]|uniref:Prepilin-type N-terminal cleavage/methylation domain-containing protein n=1 Tax=Planococcus salinus TaxID=1848460 RepID=A0A3M8PB48_9BACL|nr:prepilin-type N-terminal cleavage/methylation domain-containing protein [Planococcus salinus]RNF40927.1 prepilin-type N-terminal cleavage/methylation domain-containing protein [Planococcus salinus]